nr:hypothetical protein [Tanacetum cinerariifolium]
DKAIIELRQKFEKVEKERDNLILTLEKFEGSSKNLSRLLDSQQCDKSKTGLGYDSQGFNSQMLENQVNDKNNIGEGYHAVPSPYTENYMPPKHDLVFADEHVVNEKKLIVNDASIRRDLKLDDAEGTACLLNDIIFKELARMGKGFFGIITLLFETIMVQAPKDMGEGSYVPTNTHHIPTVTQPSSSQPQNKQKSRRKQRKEIEVPHIEPQTKESVPTPSNDPLPSGLSSSDEEGLNDQEDASKQGRIAKIDVDEDLSLIDETTQDQERLNEEKMFGVDDLDGEQVIMDVTT